MTEQKLTMNAPGASTEQVQRGVEAALTVFAQRGTTAIEVADALAARNTDEMMGAFIPPELVEAGGHPPKPTATDRQIQIADVWYEAEEAAATACYGGARDKPRDAQLVLLPPLSQNPSLH